MEQYNIKKKIADDKIQSIRQKGQQLTKRYSDLCERRQNLTQQKNDGSNPSVVNHTDKIHLNVGGTEMYATRETLTKIKGSRLEALFNGRWEDELLRDEKGRVFLDMDSRYFKTIIDHLDSMTANGDGGGEDNVSTWPTLPKATDQKMLELYIDLLRLHQEDHSGSNVNNILPHFVSSNSSNNSRIESHEDEDLLQAVKNEAQELKGIKENLDEMEKELEEEEEFVSFFTTVHPQVQVK